MISLLTISAYFLTIYCNYLWPYLIINDHITLYFVVLGNIMLIPWCYGPFRYNTGTNCIAICLIYHSEYSYMVAYWIHTVSIIDILRSLIKCIWWIYMRYGHNIFKQLLYDMDTQSHMVTY